MAPSLDAAKRFKRVDHAVAVIWKMLRIAEARFRKINAPDLLPEVLAGATYKDGVKIEDEDREAAA